ncbi:MAG: response regulator [Anaerolineaceae bacterium]|nr:response regulator [Anaerolineaceae bacterium]
MNQARLLLADDHAIVRAGIRKTLEEMPELLLVDEVGNGPDVFISLEKNDIDCLLIDVSMPNFDPIAAMQIIKEKYPTLKVLVVSAHDDDVYVQGLLSAGVNGYHMKDQPLNDLKLAVQRILEGERWISSSLIDKLIDHAQGKSATPTLTNRQRMLLSLLQQGMDNQTIAQETGLSVKTIENHLTRLYRQLNVQSRLEAVNFSMRNPQILGTPGQEAAQTETKREPEITSGINILVVDDNSRYRKQLQRMIGRLVPRATIYEAKDIKGAVHLVERIDFHLSLIDVVLGDVDGITCTRRIKAIRPNSRIVLISAYPDREFHKQGLQAGAVAFLDKKDLDLSTLRQLIADVVT